MDRQAELEEAWEQSEQSAVRLGHAARVRALLEAQGVDSETVDQIAGAAWPLEAYLAWRLEPSRRDHHRNGRPSSSGQLPARRQITCRPRTRGAGRPRARASARRATAPAGSKSDPGEPGPAGGSSRHHSFARGLACASTQRPQGAAGSGTPDAAGLAASGRRIDNQAGVAR